MNKNGFIATSLIYSFFLIFVTLFLTIIADYLQDKVLLNTIEKGIKDEINSTKSIEDFVVGDILFFECTSTNDCSSLPQIKKDTTWIIASMTYDNENTVNNESNLILYNTIADSSISCTANTCVSENNIKNDLNSTGNLNDTRINELINISENYTLYNNSQIISNNCVNLTNTVISYTNCTETDTKGYRERISIPIEAYKFTIIPGEIGGYTVTGVVS